MSRIGTLNTYASSKSTEMHLETSLYEEPLQSCPFLESLGKPLTEAKARAATTTNAFMFVLEVEYYQVEGGN